MTRLIRHPALVLILLLFITGCNTIQTGGSGSVISRIEQRGSLVLGTSANMPPMTQTLESGKIVGYDIDLARLMAQSLDVSLDIKPLPFPDLVPALERGEVDVVISNLTITQKRNKRVAFVGPYMTSGKCIITKIESLAKAEKMENLDSPDTRLAVLKGSTSEDFVRTLFPRATIVATKDHDSAVQMVSQGKAGGMLTEYPICLSTLKQNPDADFVSVFSLLTYEPIGIALPGTDPLFINWTENFLTRMDGTNALDALGAHWFGEFGEAINP